MKNHEFVTVIIDNTAYLGIKHMNSGNILINLCPHDATMILDGEEVEIPASGKLARCKQTTIRTGRTFCGFLVSRSEYGAVEGLPNPIPGYGFLVSGMVKGRVPDRLDVFAPSETIRNESGQVAGATSLGE